MARVEIRHKCVMAAREASRKDSRARVTGRSTFIKRCPTGYKIIAVEVSKRQRTCRDIFADAQKLASKELESWNKKRHWAREAKRHKKRGAHRMAVSYFYKILKENGGELTKALKEKRIERSRGEEIAGVTMTVDYEIWKKMDEESPFYYRKFGDIEEYYGAVMRMAG